MVLRHLGLADSVARRYHGRGVDPEDLQQVARLALVKAAKRYRPDSGSAFGAFARVTVSGEVKRYFRDHGWAVRPPRRLQERYADVVWARRSLEQRLGRQPSTQELAAALDLSPAQVREIQLGAQGYRTDSLVRPDTGKLRELPDLHDAYDALMTSDELHRALAELPARDRQIVQMRYVHEMTQSEIGAVLGVSQMQVSRLQAKIIDRLRVRLLGGEQQVA